MSSLAKILCSVVLFSVLSASCSGVTTDDDRLKGEPIKSQTAPSNEVDEKCLRTVKSYVDKTRKWNHSSYNIIEEQSSPDAKGFSVQHDDDLKTFLQGGLKSFHVDLDKSCGEVIRELAYQ